VNTFDTIAKKIESGVRLSHEDAIFLYREPRLPELGWLADQANRAKNGDVVYYNVNRHINPTNICVLSCRFCAYSRKPGEVGAYAYTIEQMVAKAKEAVFEGATEVHMVGGLHPRYRLAHYADMIRAIKTAFPDLHIKAFTVVELNWMAKKERRSMSQVLDILVAAGLGSLPGGGADNKVSAELWLETHRLAHQMGLKSNCTMLYGHLEGVEHRVDHMARLRALQDETHGFNAFIPLAFQPMDNDMGISRYTSGVVDLKTIAISRLFLDNFRHIKAYWIMLGQDIAQLALNFGANDLDGTVIEEKISRMAGGRSGMIMAKNDLIRTIERADKVPCERDTLYNPVSDIDPRFINDKGLRLSTLSQTLGVVTDEVQLSRGSEPPLSTGKIPDTHRKDQLTITFDQDNRCFIALRESLLIRKTEAKSLPRMIEIVVPKEDLVTPLELLKLIALTRSIFPESRIKLALNHCPALSPKLAGELPQEKFMPVFCHFGLTDLTGIDLNDESGKRIIDDLKESGIPSATKDSQKYGRKTAATIHGTRDMSGAIEL
jgi:aminodeoxyfutalosine synthase